MKIIHKAALVVAALILLLGSRAAPAAPLDAARIPADAKWVLHIDLDALLETALVKSLREKQPQLVKMVRQWFQHQYGIDPRQDLHGVTAFSDTYKSHTGTLLLFADYDLDKVRKTLAAKSKAKKTSGGEHTIYTVEKPARKEQSRQMDIVLFDAERVIFASSATRAEAAAKLLSGDAPSLEGKGSELIAEVPSGAVAYGAAIELAKIVRHDGPFPILGQHERVVWATGEHDGQVFETLTLVAQNKKVASEMKTALDGFLAFLTVWAADSESLAQIPKDVEVTLEGKTVHTRYRADTQDLVDALRELQKRSQQWQRLRR